MYAAGAVVSWFLFCWVASVLDVPIAYRYLLASLGLVFYAIDLVERAGRPASAD